MKRQAAQIKDDIRKLGPVNVNAIEDYKELLERHTFLSGQYEGFGQQRRKLWNRSIQGSLE